MLTGYSANLVRAGSHAETRRAGQNERVEIEKVSGGGRKVDGSGSRGAGCGAGWQVVEAE